jgi:hypothetical protein
VLFCCPETSFVIVIPNALHLFLSSELFLSCVTWLFSLIKMAMLLIHHFAPPPDILESYFFLNLYPLIRWYYTTNLSFKYLLHLMSLKFVSLTWTSSQIPVLIIQLVTQGWECSTMGGHFLSLHEAWVQSPCTHTLIHNCLLNTSIWISNRHFKLNTFTIKHLLFTLTSFLLQSYQT